MPAPAARGRVLIVDDEADIADSLRVLIEELVPGVAADVARNAAEAQALFRQGRRYDIVLADERMPGMPGHELLAWVGRTAPGTRRALMSAYISSFTSDVAATVGADALVQKPFVARKLVALVEGALPQGVA
ncbi:MAG: response regulator [Halobacteriales archaeon]|nr:response regulator [Halobacteriales archaeon]